MQSLSPQSQERLKEMLADLNEMLARHRRGEDPRFDEFMARHGDFFPEQPGDIDELLEALARRAAAMQALLNSMTAGATRRAVPALRGTARRRRPARADQPARRAAAGVGAGERLERLAPTSPARTPSASAAHSTRWPSSVTSTGSSRCCAASPRRPPSPRSTPSGSASCSATTPCDRCSGWPSSPAGWPTPV